MEICIGIIILIIIVVGGSVLYGISASKIAEQKRIAWTRTLNDLSSSELVRMRDELEKQKKTLHKERLLVSGYKRNIIDGELGECNQRITILDTFIEK